jgi:O-antigen ligase
MKSFFNRHKAEWPQVLAEVSVLAMVLGLFLSRAFLLAPLRLGWREWLRRSTIDPLVWIFGLCWMLPLASGIWSEDHQAWMDVVRIKLPLLLLPLGWVGFYFSERGQQRIGWALIGLVLFGAGYSIVKGFEGSDSVLRDYLSGKTLPTLLDNDRVRFSWLVVAILFWMGMGWVDAGKRLRRLYIFLSIILIMFLHVLAVRIGLLCFYLLAFFFLLRALLTPATHIRAAILMLLLIALPIAMYQWLPTFRARVNYIRYDWSHTMNGKYLSGGNDAIRIQSLQVAGDIIRAHPVAGVGFGDIRSAMSKGYDEVSPGLSEQDRIYPANEWAVYGVGMGCIGLIAFSACMIALFFFSSSHPFYGRSWALATILTMVTDIGLEVQYGVFLIPFFILIFRGYSTRIKNQEIRG